MLGSASLDPFPMSTTYNFTVLRGNTFNGVEFTVKVNGTPLDLTSCQMLAMFRRNMNVPPVLTLTVGHGISITDPANGVFQIDNQIIAIDAASYLYDIEMTLNDGTVKTYINGTMTVKETVSHE